MDRITGWRWIALETAVGLVVVLVVYLGFGGKLQAPTLALGAAAAALLFALRGVQSMGSALANDDPAIGLEYAGGTGGAAGELRDERRRVLRAIRELDFDHELGKLSDEDHGKIGGQYRMRAIELARTLDSDHKLHPRLAAELEAMHGGGGDTGEDAKQPGVGSRVCGACEAANDDDARFCKACGKELTI